MKKIIVIGEPHHGNIGDQAIFFAEIKLLKKYFHEYEIYSVHEEKLISCLEKIKPYINNDDIIMLHGGGNLGDTYDRPEYGRREVIKAFPNNKIIMFPQTTYFSNTEKGRKELKISEKIYNSHKHLVMMARENKSYEFMKEHFSNAKIYLTPDIVMTLKFNSNKQRNGALLLFRADKEKVFDDAKISYIIDLIKKEYSSYTLSDMNLNSVSKDIKLELKEKFEKYKLFKDGVENKIKNISGELREKLLEYKFNEFQTSEIVITDRLHGMIFSAITNTPCIAFASMDHKISESYKWFENLNYIKFCKDINEIQNLIKELKKIDKPEYNNEFAVSKIVDILRKEIYNKEGNKLINV